MSQDNWQQVWEIFECIIDAPAEQWAELLEEACGDNRQLRLSVEKMLDADRRGDSFLDYPFGQQPYPTDDPAAEARSDNSEPADGEDARLAGTTIGPYRLLRQIGQGGMGTVYLAVRADDEFKRRVVIKQVRRGMESEAILGRLRTERQILASLEHPYIARLYDGGSNEGMPYFVLEYVEGEQIDQYCEHGELSVEQRLTLFRKVCEAVHFAHQNLVVHRDLKPSNILVTATGEPRLLDFGIAKLLNPELGVGDGSSLDNTDTWHRILTPNYASPEQIRGQLITTASDVYSLGVLLYKLLTGRLPYVLNGRSVREIENLLLDSQPLPPSLAHTRELDQAEPSAAAIQARPTAHASQPKQTTASQREDRSKLAALRKQLSGDLDAIVMKALRSGPQQRYGSVEQLAQDIERYQLGLPVAARAGGLRYRAGKFVRRHRGAVAAATAAMLLVVGFSVAMALQTAAVAFERDQARLERDKKSQVLELVLELLRSSSPWVVPGEELSVREALQRSVPMLDQGLKQQPEVRADLLQASGSILLQLETFQPARLQLEEALDIRRSLYGDDHADVIASMSSLAAVYRGLDDLEQAEQLARQAVALARKQAQAYGPDHSRDHSPDQPVESLCNALNELVSVLCHQSKFDAALEPALEALKLSREPIAGVIQRIPALESLARIRTDQDEHREAASLRREVLALTRKRWGNDHPALIVTLNNLGLNLRKVMDFRGALAAYQEALQLQQNNFGEDNVNPSLLNNLAGVHMARGNQTVAIELFRTARQNLIERRGSDHWMVFFFGLRIADASLRQQAAVEVETDLRQLLHDWQPRLGDHWRFQLGRNLLPIA